MLPAVLQQLLPVAPQHPLLLAVLLLLLLLELELPAEGLADQSQGQQARLHTVLHPLTVLLPAAGTAAGPARLGCPLFVLVDPCLLGQQAMAAALERPLQASWSHSDSLVTLLFSAPKPNDYVYSTIVLILAVNAWHWCTSLLNVRESSSRR